MLSGLTHPVRLSWRISVGNNMLSTLLLIGLGIVIGGAVVYGLIVLAFMSSWR